MMRQRPVVLIVHLVSLFALSCGQPPAGASVDPGTLETELTGYGDAAGTIPVVPQDAVVDVRLYGALANGRMDCGPAFEAAIAAADGRPIYFPSGTYRIRSTVHIVSDYVTLIGSGQKTQILCSITDSSPLFQFRKDQDLDGVCEDMCYVSIQNLHLAGDSLTPPYRDFIPIEMTRVHNWDLQNVTCARSANAGIKLVGAYTGKISNVTTEKCAYGIYGIEYVADGDHGNSRINIDSCSFMDPDVAGIWIGKGYQISIAATEVHNNGSQAGPSQYGMYFAEASEITIQSCGITNEFAVAAVQLGVAGEPETECSRIGIRDTRIRNVSQAEGARALVLGHVSGIAVENCSIYSEGDSTIYSAGSQSNVEIRNNRIHHRDEGQIMIDASASADRYYGNLCLDPYLKCLRDVNDLTYWLESMSTGHFRIDLTSDPAYSRAGQVVKMEVLEDVNAHLGVVQAWTASTSPETLDYIRGRTVHCYALVYAPEEGTYNPSMQFYSDGVNGSISACPIGKLNAWQLLYKRYEVPPNATQAQLAIRLNNRGTTATAGTAMYLAWVYIGLSENLPSLPMSSDVIYHTPSYGRADDLPLRAITPPNGALSVAGRITAEDLCPRADDRYYLGRNDQTSPVAWKGLILKDTANGKYYRIEVRNGSVVATDLRSEE